MQISQCWHGSLLPGKYKTGKAMQDLGVFNGRDLSFEAAMVKCMHALGQAADLEGVQRIMQRNLSGEYSE